MADKGACLMAWEHQQVIEQLAIFSQGCSALDSSSIDDFRWDSSAFHSAEGCFVSGRVGQVDVSHILVVKCYWHQLHHI